MTNTTDVKELSESIDLKKYLRILYKRKWIIFIFFVLVFGGFAIYTFKQKPIFRATSSILVDSRSPSVLAGMKEVIELGTQNYWSNKSYFETQKEIILSREISRKIVEKLNLKNNPAFFGIDERERIYSEAEKNRIMTDVNAVSLLRSLITVEPVKESSVLLIHIEHTDPKLATEISNELSFTYRNQNVEYKRKITAEAYGELTELEKSMREKKETSEKNLYDFEKENNIGTIENRIKEIALKLETYTNEENDLTTRKIKLEAKLAEIRKYKNHENIFSIALPAVMDNNLITGLKGKYFDLAQKLASEESQGRLDKHPDTMIIKSQIDRILLAAKNEIANIENSVIHEYSEVSNIEKGILREIEKAKEEEMEFAWKKLQFERLSEKKKEDAEFFNLVAKRQTETQLSSQIETNNIRVLDLAVEPTSPVKPKIKINLLIGFLFAVVGGLILAYIVETLDNTIKEREDIEEFARIYFLGLLPTIKGDRKKRGGDIKDIGRDLYIFRHPKSQIAEHSRIIRTNLLFMLPEKKLQTILITSPSPQEGKTTVAINLGITMAASGSRIILVDSDMRRPRLHKTFGIPHESGLSSYLIGASAMTDIVKRTEVDNLDVIPCGPMPPNPSEILHTVNFKEFLKEIKTLYDAIIFDSPPILAVADAQIISASTDGTILVAKAGGTTRESLVNSKQRVEGVSGSVLGCIMNDLDLESRMYRYYYYHKYKYGYYYGEHKKETA
jgi:capsular exopolysaccharide synthesis family protein